MDFNKNELEVLRNIRLYKFVAIGCMVFGFLGIPLGLYNYYSHPKPYYGVYLNNALIGASIVILGMGYLMYYFVIIIEKFKKSTFPGSAGTG